MDRAPKDERRDIVVNDDSRAQFLFHVSLMAQVTVVLVKWDDEEALFPLLGFMNLTDPRVFLARLRSMAAEVGIQNAQALGTHSCKIGLGGINEVAAIGLPDNLIQRMGRWKNASMVGHYIGDERLANELAIGLTSQWPGRARA